MSALVALCLSTGVLGGLFAVGCVFIGIPAWAGFIAWGCLVQAGGDMPAFNKTVAGNIFGTICGWLAVLAMVSIPVDGNLWVVRGFLAVSLSLVIVILGSQLKPLSLLPAAIYGYAAVFGFLFQSPEARSVDTLLRFGRSNGLLSVIVAMVLGAVVGLVAGKVTAALAHKS